MTKAKADEMLTRIHTAVIGNGVKGLCARVDDVEAYIKDHPRICPMEKKAKDIWKLRGFETAVIAIFLTILQVILKVLRIL